MARLPSAPGSSVRRLALLGPIEDDVGLGRVGVIHGLHHQEAGLGRIGRHWLSKSLLKPLGGAACWETRLEYGVDESIVSGIKLGHSGRTSDFACNAMRFSARLKGRARPAGRVTSNPMVPG